MKPGVLPVDKPEGPTSHDAVALARRALGTRRIGHTGTLDPFASGLLLLCVGSATRLAELLTGLPKTYVARARCGARTDTDDRTGSVVEETADLSRVTREAVEGALREQLGERMQRPPAYSAKKVAGERAYARARRGESTELEPVAVEIRRIALTDFEPPEFGFEVECSSGTYVRAIARDVGDALGVGAHLVALRRTRIGAFDVTRALPVDALSDRERVAAAWIEPLEAVRDLPRYDADARAAEDVAHGRPVQASLDAPDGATAAIAHEGSLLALARTDAGWLRPFRVFANE